MRKTPLKKVSSQPISKLKKECWKLFSIYIRTRKADKDGFVSCITCGMRKHWKEGDAGHFVAGRPNYILFDERAVHFQCKPCNGGLMVGITNPAQKIKENYEKFMLKKYGQKVINELRTYKVKQFTRQELEELKEDLKKRQLV